MIMILAKLSEIKLSTLKNIKNESKKLLALKSINKILCQIDFSTEDVKINNTENLKKVLTSLKGDKLNKNEIKLVREIIEK